MDERAEGGAGGVLTVVAIYALWLLTGVIAFGVCVTWHTSLQRLYVVLGFNKYGLAAFTYAVIIALVLGWLILLVVAESWYRRAAEQGRLVQRAAWTIGALVALVALGLAVGLVG